MTFIEIAVFITGFILSVVFIELHDVNRNLKRMIEELEKLYKKRE